MNPNTPPPSTPKTIDPQDLGFGLGFIIGSALHLTLHHFIDKHTHQELKSQLQQDFTSHKEQFDQHFAANPVKLSRVHTSISPTPKTPLLARALNIFKSPPPSNTPSTSDKPTPPKIRKNFFTKSGKKLT